MTSMTTRRDRRASVWPAIALCLAIVALAGCDAPTTEDIDGPFGSPLGADATLHEILRHPDVFERTIAVSHYLKRAEPSELDDIQDEFAMAPLDRGDVEYALFGAWWARFDPVSALFYAENHLRTMQPRVVNEILRTWATMDPHGLRDADAYGQALVKMSGFRTEMMDAIVVGWYESGKPGMDEFIFEQTDSEARAYGIKAWARMKVIHEGPEAALAWTQSVDYHADTKRTLLASALAVVANEDPQLCVEWFEKAGEMGVDVATFVPRIANVWGRHDPRAAIEWVMQFSFGAERQRAISRVARRWRERDPVELQDWLDEQEAAIDPKTIGLLRYQTYRAIVEDADFQPDWRDLLRRADSLSEQNRRSQIVLWVLQRWHYVDQAATEAWLAEQRPDLLPEVLVKRIELLEDEEKAKIDRVLGRLDVTEL